jgi:TetR/AcrR family transcriptional regulator, cholesterol catabolism regulator
VHEVVGAGAAALGRRERKKREVERRIRLAAAELIREKGYDETTVEEIAARADISKGTFFNYFPRKDALLVAFAETLHDELIEELGEPESWPGDGAAQLRRLFLHLASKAERYPALSRTMVIENMRTFWLRTSEEPIERRFRDLVERVVKRSQARGEMLGVVDPATAARLIEAAYVTTVIEWLRDASSGRQLRGELNARLDIVFRGLGAAEPTAGAAAKGRGA